MNDLRLDHLPSLIHLFYIFVSYVFRICFIVCCISEINFTILYATAPLERAFTYIRVYGYGIEG